MLLSFLDRLISTLYIYGGSFINRCYSSKKATKLEIELLQEAQIPINCTPVINVIDIIWWNTRNSIYVISLALVETILLTLLSPKQINRQVFSLLNNTSSYVKNSIHFKKHLFSLFSYLYKK